MNPSDPASVENLLIQHIRKDLQSVTNDGESYFNAMHKAAACLVSTAGNVLVVFLSFYYYLTGQNNVGLIFRRTEFSSLLKIFVTFVRHFFTG